MRILYITPFLQHPMMQGPTRHYHLIRGLSERHSITLLSLTRSPVKKEAVEELQRYTDNVIVVDASRSRSSSRLIKWLIGRHQLAAGVRQMKGAFRRLVNDETFDLVVFHGKSVFPVIDGWEGLPLVVDFCDATSMNIKSRMQHGSLLERPLLLLRYYSMRRIEKKLIGKTRHVAFISGRDRAAVLGRDSRATIIPLGMDLDYWTPRAPDPEPACLMFSGGMDYRPNIDAALFLIKKIFPRIRRALPTARLMIVGRDPVPDLYKAADGVAGITITGAVEDMRPFFECATVYVAPVRFGAGTQNKLLEALAMGVPVVTTPTSTEGLKNDPNDQLPLVTADNAAEFAHSIVELLSSPRRREQLARSGRSFIEDRFVWSNSIGLLEQMCIDALNDEAKHAKDCIAVNNDGELKERVF